MSGDEKFKIGIEVGNLERSVKGTQKLADNFTKLSAHADKIDLITGKFRQLEQSITSANRVLQQSVRAMNSIAMSSKIMSQAEKINIANTKESARVSRELAAVKKLENQANKEAAATKRIEAQTEIANIKAKTEAIRLSEAQYRQSQRTSKETAKGGAYNQLRNELSQYTTKIKDAIASGKVHGSALEMMGEKYSRLQAKLTGVNAGFVSLTGQTKNTDTATQMLGRSFSYFLGQMASDLFRNGIMNMLNFGKAISDAGVKMDALNNIMLVASGGWSAGQRGIGNLIQMSNALGMSFGAASESYGKFATSFTRSGGTVEQANKIFQDMSSAAVSMHLTPEAMNSVFIALEQMANKGTVQSEELKRQLGNVLPGAFELAAESMGVLPAKLMEMMKAGEVFTKDFLPKFAKTVNEVLGQGISIAVVQFNANMQRLITSTDLLKMSWGQGLNSALIPVVKLLTGASNVLLGLSKFLERNVAVASALKAVMVPLTLAISAFVWTIGSAAVSFGIAQLAGTAFFVAMQIGTASLTASAIALNASLGGLPLVIGLVTTAVIGLGFYIAEMSKKAADTSPYIGLRNQIVTLTKSVTELDLATKEGKKALAGYKEDFPVLAQYLLDTDKKFKDLTKEELKNIAAMGVHEKEMQILAEKTKELGSWQNTLAAEFSMAWDSIKRTVASALKPLLDAFDSIGNKAGSVISKINNVRIAANKVSKDKYYEGLSKEDKVKYRQEEAKYKEYAEGKTGAVASAKQKIADANAKKKLDLIKNQEDKIYKDLLQSQRATRGMNAGGDGKDKNKSKKEADTAWDKLGKEISATEELMRVRMLNGQSVDNLLPKYLRLKKQQDDINDSIQKLSAPLGDMSDKWKNLEKQLTETEDKYKYMLANSTEYTAEQIKQQAIIMRGQKVQVGYNKLLEESADLTGISSRAANQLTNTLVDGLFTKLGEGETMWGRFKQAGLDTIKALASEWVRSRLVLASAGFQANLSNFSAANPGSSLGSKIGAGLSGFMKGLRKEPLEGFKKEGGLAGGITGGASAIGGMAQDLATSAAGSATLTASMAALAPIAIAAAPAMMAMSGSLAAIATTGTSAAVAMAALAVATAANSVAGIPIAGAILAPIAALATGGAIAAATALTGASIGASAIMAGGGQMIGGAMSGIGNLASGGKVIKHAKGGIVSSPTSFPMQGGNIGVAGEAGTEVIAPARRMSNGDVGVGAVAPNVTINNYANTAVEVIKRPDNEIEIKITELNAMLASSRTNKGMSAAQSRLQSKGRQVG